METVWESFSSKKSPNNRPHVRGACTRNKKVIIIHDSEIIMCNIK